MRKVLQLILFISTVSIFIISCEKGTEPFPPVRSQEKATISFPAGNSLVTVALDISNTVITAEVLEIRRDATSPADLNRVQVVKIAKNNSVLSDLSGAEVTELSRDLYQNHPDNPFDGQYWTITFQPGEFVKHLKINLKTIDLVTLGRVGLGFQLASAENAVLSDSQNQVAVELGAKNQWDGVYRVRYRLFHPTNPDITGIGTIPEWDFPTSGPRSIDWDFATIHISFPTGGLGFFGLSATQPTLQTRMTVNPDNSVTVSNVAPFAAAGSFPPLVVPPGVINRYDPATKTFYVAYTWTPAGAGTRERYDTLTYLRPR